jgi:hypothetical protein
MFRITSEYGFHIKFKNRYTISVVWSPGTYSDNYNFFDHGRSPLDGPIKNSHLVEIAIIGPDDKLITVPEWGDQVKGYCDSDEVSHWIVYAASLPSVKNKIKCHWDFSIGAMIRGDFSSKKEIYSVIVYNTDCGIKHTKREPLNQLFKYCPYCSKEIIVRQEK